MSHARFLHIGLQSTLMCELQAQVCNLRQQNVKFVAFYFRLEFGVFFQVMQRLSLFQTEILVTYQCVISDS